MQRCRCWLRTLQLRVLDRCVGRSLPWRVFTSQCQSILIRPHHNHRKRLRLIPLVSVTTPALPVVMVEAPGTAPGSCACLAIPIYANLNFGVEDGGKQGKPAALRCSLIYLMTEFLSIGKLMKSCSRYLLLDLPLFTQSVQIGVPLIPPVPDVKLGPNLIQVRRVCRDYGEPPIGDPKEDITGRLRGDSELCLVLDKEPVVACMPVLTEDHHIIRNRLL